MSADKYYRSSISQNMFTKKEIYVFLLRCSLKKLFTGNIKDSAVVIQVHSAQEPSNLELQHGIEG